MASDIRISTAFLDHPKTIKLERRLGIQGLKSLLALWLWSRDNKPCGTLNNMDAEDIEIAARWSGESGTFVNECLTLRWLDVNESLTENNGVTYSLHDWADHNSWAVGADERSNASRFSRMAKTHPELYEKLSKSGVKAISAKEYQELTKNNESLTNVNAPLSPAPAPAPSPSPAPIVRGKTFKPPLLEEVKAYCQERNNSVDPEKWHDHYTANGWMVGKSKMKCWKAAVRTWEKNGFSAPAAKTNEWGERIQ